MSLAARAVKAKILTIDIERMKGSASIEFWDLGDYKGRRIRPDDVTEWPRTICAAWRWYGTRRIDFASEWGDGRDEFLTRVWHAYDDADIVVGHNIDGFDTKHLNTSWWTMGLGMPSPYKTVDTLKVARRHLGAESKTLDALLKRLGEPGKTDRYDVELARKALAGDKAAQGRLMRYNKGDIAATERLYESLRGWNPSHPHLGLYSGVEDCCYACGGTSFTRLAKDPVALSQSYAGYRCDNCGANVRNNHRRRITTLRPAR